METLKNSEKLTPKKREFIGALVDYLSVNGSVKSIGLIAQMGEQKLMRGRMERLFAMKPEVKWMKY